MARLPRRSGPHRSRRSAAPGAAALAAALLALPAAAEAAGDGPPVDLLESDSRAPYVHRLTLYDHEGTVIDPASELAGPYSPRMTCGKCHDYAAISGGWHFSAARAEVPPGRPGEPWLLVDPRAATQVPVSGRPWPGVLAPRAAGLSDWQFIKRFGRHLPGGGFGEPDAAALRAAPEAARWRISGPLEIDCMFCHSADQQHDPSEAARQIEAENFRWSPTVALGLAVVRGEARKVPDDWDPLQPPSPDYPEQAGPRLVWDLRRFDPDDRVLFEITRRPPNERCYFCHSFRAVGADAPDELVAAQDVHLAAGLLCVDCHGNGLDHRITRGYPAEAGERGELGLAAFTCQGCHLGVPGATDPEVARGGLHGAPHPQHRGLPPVHFEKLTCTACHAGPWPADALRRYQTALAHGLGLATRERTADTPPFLAAPVFVRQPDGAIAPHRLAWAAYPRPGPDGALTPPPERQPAGPYTWPLAHNVRPARQSLGIGGCTDCHVGGMIDYGRPGSRDGLVPPAAESMLALRGDDRALAAAWNLGFRFREAFKWAAFACAGLLALLLLRYGLDGLRAVAAAAGPAPAAAALPETVPARPPTRFEHAVHAVAGAAFLVLGATGFYGRYVVGGLGGWLLLVHMAAAPLFIAGLTGVALQWAHRGRLGLPALDVGGLTLGQRLLLWLGLVLGLAVILPMLAAMLPVFGYAAQALLVEVHALSGLLLVGVMAVHTVVSYARRRARGRQS